MRGDYFVTSGEVLIPSWTVQGTGNQRTIVADVEWTFPLEFVEVVSGDGKKTDRKVDSGHRAAGVRQASLPDSVRRDRQEMGAHRGVGLGRQRRDGPAGEALGNDGDDGRALTLRRAEEYAR